MQQPALIDLARAAEEWVAQAGDIALAQWGKAAVHRKPDGTEVTDADLSMQRMLIQAIAGRCPGHAIIAEETLDPPVGELPSPATRYCWVIDPLDGTRNYAHGYPAFATSVALMDHGQPVIGVVRWHHTGQLFTAVAGLGTTLNGEAVRVTDAPMDSSALIGAQVGPSHRTQAVVAPWLNRWSVRNMGATSLHLALVASGALAAAYAKDCWIWDLAAGALLVTEAGGQCTGTEGQALFPVDPATCDQTNYPFVAGSPTAHRTILADLGDRS